MGAHFFIEKEKRSVEHPEWIKQGTNHYPNGANIAAKGNQSEQHLLQNQAMERSNFYLFFRRVSFRHNIKNGHGALVGLTDVKGTSVDTLFFF